VLTRGGVRSCCTGDRRPYRRGLRGPYRRDPCRRGPCESGPSYMWENRSVRCRGSVVGVRQSSECRRREICHCVEDSAWQVSKARKFGLSTERADVSVVICREETFSNVRDKVQWSRRCHVSCGGGQLSKSLSGGAEPAPSRQQRRDTSLRQWCDSGAEL
jgi:hypothetical protein